VSKPPLADIETKRFLLRKLGHQDIDGMYALDSDPEVHKYLGGNTISRKDEALSTIDHVIAQYDKYGIGRWAIINKKDNSFVGWSGLKYETNSFYTDQPYYDIGYRILKKYWQQGIASETAIASLDYGFNTLGLSKINAAAHIENIGSIKVLERIGLTLKDQFYYKELLCNWYEITISDYRQKLQRDLINV